MPQSKPLEQIAYEAYGASTDWKNFLGQQMPSWENLPTSIQRAWRAATVGAVEEFAGRVNERAEGEMPRTNRIEGAHHRGIEAELAELRIGG